MAQFKKQRIVRASRTERVNLEEVDIRYLPECICCSAPVFVKDAGACHICLGVTLDTSGRPLPAEVNVPRNRYHRWTGCKAVNRHTRRMLFKQIRLESRRRQSHKNFDPKDGKLMQEDEDDSTSMHAKE